MAKDLLSFHKNENKNCSEVLITTLTSQRDVRVRQSPVLEFFREGNRSRLSDQPFSRSPTLLALRHPLVTLNLSLRGIL